MQVGLKPGGMNTLSPSSLRRRGVVNTTQGINKHSPANDGLRSEFPESPLLSTRPLRYNIQLNQQLTSVQQADSYLGQVENQILQLRYAAHHTVGRDITAITAQASELTKLISHRSSLSGGTIDRQLNVVLDGQPKVDFTLRGVDGLLNNDQNETLIFSLGGHKRELSAVQIAEYSSAQQTLHTLNLGLGRFNIHGQVDNQQVVFSVTESQWPRLRDHLSVRGEGHRYPEGQFYPVKLTAEPALEEQINQVAAAPGLVKKRMPELLQALEHVTLQRRKLAFHKDNVNQRVESLATFQSQGTAVDASLALKQTLINATENYPVLLQATAGQANVHGATVKNLLG